MADSNNTKIAIGLLLAAGLGYALVKSNNSTVENFSAGIPKMISIPENAYNRDAVHIPPWIQSRPESNPWSSFFYSRPDGKPAIAPRAFPGSITGQIRGYEPPAHLMANNPLEPIPGSDHKLLSENYTGDSYNPVYSDALQGVSNDQMNSMYDNYARDLQDRQTMLTTEDLLPNVSMDAGIGETYYGQNMADPNTWLTDSHITVLQKHRNAEMSLSLAMVGDLPIRPMDMGWFNSSVGRSAYSVLSPGYFNTQQGAPIETEQDGLDTTVISHRNEDARAGLRHQRII